MRRSCLLGTCAILLVTVSSPVGLGSRTVSNRILPITAGTIIAVRSFIDRTTVMASRTIRATVLIPLAQRKPPANVTAPLHSEASAMAQDDGYCAQQYRSYDPASVTFLGYDGLRHHCP
jgi:hypothetical protein